MAITYQISVDKIFSAKDKDGKKIDPYEFVIKSYQRGYRWGPVHIHHLIEDLCGFDPIENRDGKTITKKYCLQPIIVKGFVSQNNQWELVDGQQRIISLWLMRRICFWLSDDETVDGSFYKIKFENKENLQNFVDRFAEKTNDHITLRDLKKILNKYEEEPNKSSLHEYFDIQQGENIDVDCIIESIRTVLLYPHIKRLLERIFYQGVNNTPPTSESFILVWYQLDNNNSNESDVITVFSNINANKIKLTESELIKAQLLYNLRGLEKKKEEEAKLSFQWEEIERELCNDGFWYFLNAGEGKQSGTRIDFLFEIWAKVKQENSNSTQEYVNESDYPLSDLIENIIKGEHSDIDKANKAMNIWNEICCLFDKLKDWEKDYYFYHIIGLLVAINKIKQKNESASDVIKKCISFYENCQSKDQFKYFLKSLIRNEMFSICNYREKDNGNSNEKRSFADFVDKIKDLNYEGTKDHKAIKIILLMHNIASLINAKNEHERFPFELFFTDKYDIEHVNPQNPDEENIEELREWYKAMGESFDENSDGAELLKNAKSISDKKNLHKIGNLVLLDENTNRSYKNKSFFEKRKIIIDILRTGRQKLVTNGQYEKYIPIGTKWVFLKAFSDLEDPNVASVSHIWNGEEYYKDDLIKQLWILQSPYKKINNDTYCECKIEMNATSPQNGKNEISQQNILIVDSDGKYRFLEWNSPQNQYKTSQKKEINITIENSNGLLPEGSYNLNKNGILESECNK